MMNLPLQKWGKRILEEAGYDVTIANASQEAFDLFKKNCEKFDLVITDLTMPGMNGDKLAEKILDVRSNIPVVLCSGYQNKHVMNPEKKNIWSAFVQKPIEQETIINTIRTVLDKNTRGGITMTEKKISILVVDDEQSILKLAKRLVLQEGYDCLVASNGLEAITVMEDTVVDVVITDVAMPKMGGIELTKQIKENYSADVIMMTGYFKDLSYENAVTQGATDFIQKPFSTKEFQIRLRRVIKERKTKQELKNSLKRMNDIVDGVINSLSSTVDARDPVYRRPSETGGTACRCNGYGDGTVPDHNLQYPYGRNSP